MLCQKSPVSNYYSNYNTFIKPNQFISNFAMMNTNTQQTKFVEQVYTISCKQLDYDTLRLSWVLSDI